MLEMTTDLTASEIDWGDGPPTTGTADTDYRELLSLALTLLRKVTRDRDSLRDQHRRLRAEFRRMGLSASGRVIPRGGWASRGGDQADR